jgi:outer membrane protein TolC
LLAGIAAQLLANRPDVRASELNLVAANARIGVAQDSMYPALMITGNGGLNAFRASKWFVLPSSLFYTIAGGLTQPLFERAQLRTQLTVARIQYEQAVIEFRQAVTNGVREVSDALGQLEKLKEQERVATSRVATLKNAVINARHLFAAGMANYLEVITAQGNALQAELMLAQLKQQQLLATVNLYRALGGGGQ